MYVKQISVFIENTQGRIADIAEVIAEEGIDIRALSLADTSEFGILRLIVDRPNDAKEALKKAGYTVSLTAVVAIEIPDRPGGLSKALRILSDADISVEYLYAFISRELGRASVILRVDEGDRARDLLLQAGIRFLTDEDITEM